VQQVPLPPNSPLENTSHKAEDFKQGAKEEKTRGVPAEAVGTLLEIP
jgi:hypothetical protein